MITRANIELDSELVNAAAALLGTTRKTDTVDAALRDVVARDHRRRLAARDLFAELSPAQFLALRRTRERGD